MVELAKAQCTLISLLLSLSTLNTHKSTVMLRSLRFQKNLTSYYSPAVILSSSLSADFLALLAT